MIETLLTQYGYRALFPISFLEWQISTIISGFLVSTGYFNVWVVMPLVIIADLCSDAMYYMIGYTQFGKPIVQKWMDKSWFLSKNIDLMRYLREKHPFKTMVFGKNAYMISLLIIMSAGATKMSYKRFLSISLPACIMQYGVLLLVWYYLGEWYATISDSMAYPALIVLIIFVGVFIWWKRWWKYITQSLIKEGVQVTTNQVTNSKKW